MPAYPISPRSPRHRPSLALAACMLVASLPLHAADSAIDGGPYSPLAGMVRVSGGSDFSCAMGSGAMRCWGSNVYGQLGDGGSEESTIAVSVIALGAPRSIGTGGSHACAATQAGAARCWAYNYFGQVGDGTDVDAELPTAVVGLASGVTEIATGMNHSCALLGSGGVKCWGANGFGQVGDGSDTNRLAPVDVSGLASGIIAIAAGGEHTCALASTGAVRCWGSNDYGQLGDGTTTQRSTPVPVSGLSSGVRAIAAGRFHTCAVMNAGGMKCWGSNDYGELGDGTQNERYAPVDVSGLSGAQSAAAGNGHTCAIVSGGGVRCWGANTWGQLGDGTSMDRTTPVVVSSLTGATWLGLGAEHSCASRNDGRVACWGYNGYGQLGDGSWNDSPVPVLVLQGDDVFENGFE